VWISTLDLTRLSQSIRVEFHTMSAQLRRPLQRSAAFVRRTSSPETEYPHHESRPKWSSCADRKSVLRTSWKQS
jgi:hypothetical protein